MPQTTSHGLTAAATAVEAKAGASVAVVIACAGARTPESGAAEVAREDTGALGLAVAVPCASEAAEPAVVEVVGTEVPSAAVIPTDATTVFCPGSSVHDTSTGPPIIGLPLPFFRT